ncbi:MAG: ribonuclease P protein component [Acidobacteria bacterium]|nr:MAG: ribonuclease P protein component [Acidobacteriota bacterium]
MPQPRDESFSRKHRLHKATDFRRIFSRGKRISSQSFVLYLLPNNLGVSRLGIQVKAKIGTAARRNYIKRIVREVFRRKKNELRRPIDIIFIAEKGMAALKYQELKCELEGVLQKY